MDCLLTGSFGYINDGLITAKSKMLEANVSWAVLSANLTSAMLNDEAISIGVIVIPEIILLSFKSIDTV